MFVLDGSGSMWGKLGSDPRAKFEFSRDALRETLPRLRPDVRAGLASFGHRREATAPTPRSSCRRSPTTRSRS